MIKETLVNEGLFQNQGLSIQVQQVLVIAEKPVRESGQKNA